MLSGGAPDLGFTPDEHLRLLVPVVFHLLPKLRIDIHANRPIWSAEACAASRVMRIRLLVQLNIGSVLQHSFEGVLPAEPPRTDHLI